MNRQFAPDRKWRRLVRNGKKLAVHSGHFGIAPSLLTFQSGGMEPTTSLENWLTLRPALIHIYEGPVPLIGRDAGYPAGGNHFAWLLEKGNVVVHRPEKTVSAARGDWLIVHPGARWQKFSPDARIISVQFQLKWPDGCNLFENGLSVVFPSVNYPDLEGEARRMLREMRGVLPDNPIHIQRTPLAAGQYFGMQHSGLGFLSALIRALTERGLAPARVGQVDERLLNVQRQLDQWPVNRLLEEGANTLLQGWTRDTLDRRFHKAFGVTPTQYLENRRRNYARRLLGHSTVPIKEIASNLGFRALADFSSWFKRAHQLSPRAYRRSVAAAGLL